MQHGSWYHKSRDVAQKFEYLPDAHRRPDGNRWTGQQLDEATGGVITRSYVTNLRKGRIENPGYEKMLEIAREIAREIAMARASRPKPGWTRLPVATCKSPHRGRREARVAPCCG